MIDKIVKVEVTHKFKVSEYSRLYNIKRVDGNQEYNRFIPGDTFDCDIEFCKHLMEPPEVVKVIEIRDNDINMS